MLTARVLAATAAIALSTLYALSEPASIVVVSGVISCVTRPRDGRGARPVRCPADRAISWRWAAELRSRPYRRQCVVLIDLKGRSEIGRLPSRRSGHRPEFTLYAEPCNRRAAVRHRSQRR